MIAIVVVTRNALELAKRIQSHFPDSKIFAHKVLGYEEGEVIEGDLKGFTGALFQQYDSLVFVMAMGIVMRCIAPWLQHKSTDPGVVVMDEKGTFAISLLSGHLGGANELTRTIAAKVNAIPVITTATDVQGLLSVDMFAKQHGLMITSFDEVKRLTAMLVNGRKLALVNETALALSGYDSRDEADGLIYITHKKEVRSRLPFARLLASNVVAGIGCRRGVPAETIISFVENEVEKLGLDFRCIRSLASIDLKQDEVGLLEAARHWNLPLSFVTKEQINALETDFTRSEFVQSAVGVGGVCEPAAFIIGSEEGRFLLRKFSGSGVTLALFECLI